MKDDEYLDNDPDAAPAMPVGVNRTASDFTPDEWAQLTPAQREQFERTDGTLPVDHRSPLYHEPAAENFVHGSDPRVATGEVEATDTATVESQPGVFNVLAGDVPPTDFDGGNGPAEHLALDGDEAPPVD